MLLFWFLSLSPLVSASLKSNSKFGKADTDVHEESPLVSSNPAFLWSFDKFKEAAQQKQGILDLSTGLDVAASTSGHQFFGSDLFKGLDGSKLGFGKNVETAVMNEGEAAGMKKWQLPIFDFGKNAETVVTTGAEAAGIGKWQLPKLDFGKNVETVVMTEEEVAEMKKKWELPKIEKGPVKEVPIYVYKLPPWPKLELPKMKDIPLVIYEMPEIKPLPELKLPEFRIEKYILPKLEALKFPEIEPPKEIPLVMYEFPMPDIKPLDLPKIEPIKEIPIYTFEFPPLPEVKPIELPKIKMPEVKVVRKKLPPLPELKPLDLPKMDLPKIKVVKYEMSDLKSELPKLPELKIPEIKFVKHEVEVKKELPKMPDFKLPEFKLPEMKPIELPEFKLPELKFPEIKPLELPELHFPQVYPMVIPQMQYVYTPVMPMPYNYPLMTTGQHVAGGFKAGFGGFKAKQGNLVLNAGMGKTLTGGAGVHGSVSGEGEAESGHNSEHVVVGSNLGSGMFYPGLYGHYGYHGGHGHPHHFGSDVLISTGNDVILEGDEDVSQLYVADGHNGLTMESFTPWNHHFANLFSPAVHQNPASWFGALHGNLEKDVAIDKKGIVHDYVNATIAAEL